MSEIEIPMDEPNDGLDPGEDTSGGGTGTKPWDPGKIRITTKSFSLRDVVQQIRDKEIDLAPDFQREYVWSIRQRTRLVESILLGIPLPAFYFNQDRDGMYQVVDGVQRLSTIALFMSDKHILSQLDLEYLVDLDACTYSLLDGPALRRFRSTQIVVHVIEPQTPDDVKFDIFNRVNTLGSPLSSQEVRHAMSKERSRAFLLNLIVSSEFDAATGHQYWRTDRDTGERVRDGKRMTDRELALRFCAFRHFSPEIYRGFESLDAYLNEFTRRLDGVSEKMPPLSENEISRLRSDFTTAMRNASKVLGNAAFRRWPLDQSRRGPINRALFEAQSIALAEYPFERLEPLKETIVTRFRACFNDPRYLRAVTVGTGDTNNIEERLQTTKRILVDVVG